MQKFSNQYLKNFLIPLIPCSFASDYTLNIFIYFTYLEFIYLLYFSFAFFPFTLYLLHFQELNFIFMGLEKKSA